jgi:hypothetical protein
MLVIYFAVSVLAEQCSIGRHRWWHNATCQSAAHWSQNGKTEYKSVTISPDATAEEFMDLYLDDDNRPNWVGPLAWHWTEQIQAKRFWLEAAM